MATQCDLVALMNGFHAQAKLEGKEQEGGGYRLVFDEVLVVYVFGPEENPEGESALAYLTAATAPLPDGPGSRISSQLMRELMGANYFPEDPFRFYSIQPETGHVAVTSWQPQEGLDAEAFEQWITGFVEHAQLLRQQLLSAAGGDGPRPGDGYDGGGSPDSPELLPESTAGMIRI